MNADFKPIEWDTALERDCRALIQLALREDTLHIGDLTTQALVDPDRQGAAQVASRQSGVVVGVNLPSLVIEEAKANARWTATAGDSDRLAPGAVVGTLEGNARDLLTCERVILNLMSRLCGVASLTSEYVSAIQETSALVYDTRKTTPGWRLLEKFAVRCGGGMNHRTGLYDAVLIKDNHLALAKEEKLSPADAVVRARESERNSGRTETVIEVEVDTLAQLEQVLPAAPDIVLLDNMPPATLRDAVALRDQHAPNTVLEASGGVRLDTIKPIAESGVDRISVGAITHSAIGLDLGLDWL